jgi:hypothetical protein
MSPGYVNDPKLPSHTSHPLPTLQLLTGVAPQTMEDVAVDYCLLAADLLPTLASLPPRHDATCRGPVPCLT